MTLNEWYELVRPMLLDYCNKESPITHEIVTQLVIVTAQDNKLELPMDMVEAIVGEVRRRFGTNLRRESRN